jgi:hypothetical protein
MVALIDDANVDNKTRWIRVRVEMVEYQGTFAKIHGRAMRSRFRSLRYR